MNFIYDFIGAGNFNNYILKSFEELRFIDVLEN